MLDVLSALAGTVFVAYAWSTMLKDFAKALGWVAEVGGKLVVVPVGAEQ